MVSVKARRDVDGCGCLDCRDLDAAAVRRPVLDAAIWSLRLLRSYPSIAASALAIVLARRALAWLGPSLLPGLAVGLFEAGFTFAFVVLLRAYVSTIVAGELTGAVLPPGDRVRRSVDRVPALVGVLAAIVAALAATMIGTLFATLALMALLVAGPFDPSVVAATPVAAGIGIVTVSVPLLYVLFKLWLAIEACVVGGYGPLASLRVSWRITGAFRTKLLVAILAVIASAGSLYLAGLAPVVGTGDGSLLATALEGATRILGDLTSVVWYGVYAHLYVQAVVDDSTR